MGHVNLLVNIVFFSTSGYSSYPARLFQLKGNKIAVLAILVIFIKGAKLIKAASHPH